MPVQRRAVFTSPGWVGKKPSTNEAGTEEQGWQGQWGAAVKSPMGEQTQRNEPYARNSLCLGQHTEQER